MSTARLLTFAEPCLRKGYFSRSWELHKLNPSQMVMSALKSSLTASQAPPWGELAGSAIMQLAQDRGMAIETTRLYEAVIHHAAMSDLLVTSIRKPDDSSWLIPEPLNNWKSDCLFSPDGSRLRRIVLASHWSDERHFSECRSWFTLGEIAAYGLPMQLIVFVIGQLQDGKRSTPWTTGFLHPKNHQLRFRKKSRTTSEVFNDKWERIHREDHAEIERDTWLEAMLKDDVLPEVCFRVDIPIPPPLHLRRIREMAKAKIDRLCSLKETPEANLSTCDWPVPCQFLKLCHTLPEKEPHEKYGFDRIQTSQD